MKKFFVLGLFPLMMLALAACSTSKLTTSWKSDNAAQLRFKKVLVLGLLSNKNRAVKDKMESELVLDLKKFGQEAVAASQSFGPKAFNKLNETEALEKLANEGFDGVITVSLVNKDSTRVTGGGGWGPGFYPYYGRFWGYYSFYSPWVYGPGLGYGYGYPGYYNTTSYSFETNIYDITSNNTLVYSAQSESFDPSSASNLAIDYARSIVKDLKKNNLLGIK